MRRRRNLLLLGALFLVLALLDWTAMFQWVAYGEPKLTNLGFEVSFARTMWLPGPPAIIPPQECPRCRADDHERCSSKIEQLVFGTRTPRSRSSFVATAPGKTKVLVVPFGTKVGPTPIPGEFAIFLDDFESEDGEIRCSEISLPRSGVSRSIFKCDCCPPGE